MIWTRKKCSATFGQVEISLAKTSHKGPGSWKLPMKKTESISTQNKKHPCHSYLNLPACFLLGDKFNIVFDNPFLLPNNCQQVSKDAKKCHKMPKSAKRGDIVELVLLSTHVKRFSVSCMWNFHRIGPLGQFGHATYFEKIDNSPFGAVSRKPKSISAYIALVKRSCVP